MQIEKFLVLDYEMVHWADENLFIAHKANRITYIKDGNETKIQMPSLGKWYLNFSLISRKLRRLCRTDKVVIYPVDDYLLVIRFGRIMRYSLKIRNWEYTGYTLNCRNPMYNGILRIPSGELFVGEYGRPNGVGKRILKSNDSGKNWTVVYQFKSNEIRHIHCLSWDPISEKIWIGTGDDDTECCIFIADKNFENNRLIGKGSQHWRTCHFIFSEKTVDWIMDSPTKEVHHIRYDRSRSTISVGSCFPGPVWFSALKYDWYYAITAQESGPSLKDRHIHFFRSQNLYDWEEMFFLHKDYWPKGFFRFGTVTIARGAKCFFSCEGIQGIDGKSISLL